MKSGLRPTESSKFDRKLKPEAVARTTIGNRQFTLSIFDASRHMLMD